MTRPSAAATARPSRHRHARRHSRRRRRISVGHQGCDYNAARNSAGAPAGGCVRGVDSNAAPQRRQHGPHKRLPQPQPASAPIPRQPLALRFLRLLRPVPPSPRPPVSVRPCVLCIPCGADAAPAMLVASAVVALVASAPCLSGLVASARCAVPARHRRYGMTCVAACLSRACEWAYRAAARHRRVPALGTPERDTRAGQILGTASPRRRGRRTSTWYEPDRRTSTWYGPGR